MSWSIRDQAQRKIKQSINHITTILENLHWIDETYEDKHPEVSDPTTQIATVLIFVQESLEKLSRQF